MPCQTSHPLITINYIIIKKKNFGKGSIDFEFRCPFREGYSGKDKANGMRTSPPGTGMIPNDQTVTVSDDDKFIKLTQYRK
jgi:hypothetical protein